MVTALMGFFSAFVAIRRLSKFEDGVTRPPCRSKLTEGHDGRRDHRAREDLVDLPAVTVSASMTFRFATVASHAASVLDELTRDLALGEHRKIDRSPGFMAVVVEHLEQREIGSLYSVAHYFEQNGDLVADPDVVFLRRGHGLWTPVSIQAPLGGYRVVVRIREDGRVEVDGRGQRELVRYANMWMKNVAAQQGIKTKRTR